MLCIALSQDQPSVLPSILHERRMFRVVPVLPLCKVGGSSARYLSCTSLLVFYWTLQVLSPPLSHHPPPPSTLAAILTNFLPFHPLLLCLLYRSHASLPSLRNAIAKNGFFLNRFLVRLPEARGEQLNKQTSGDI